MKLLKFLLPIVVLSITNSSFAHPLDGKWHFRDLRCVSTYDETHDFRPFADSEFKSDAFLTLKILDTQIDGHRSVSTLDTRKSVTALGCPNAETNAILKTGPTLFVQKYIQQVTSNSSQNQYGIIKGLQLGPMETNPDIDNLMKTCDPKMVSIGKFFATLLHMREESNRTYHYYVNEKNLVEGGIQKTKSTLVLRYVNSYLDSKLLYSPCKANEVHVLEFDKVD